MKKATQLDPFRFGWRYARQPGSNGRTELERIPLTPEDVLHPREGDEITENTVQMRDRNYLLDVLKLRVADRSGFLVLSDVIVDWGVPGLRNHSPDLSVFEDVADPTREWGIFRVVEAGARSVLVI